jgi:hypothetical protein
MIKQKKQLIKPDDTKLFSFEGIFYHKELFLLIFFVKIFRFTTIAIKSVIRRIKKYCK